MIDLASFKSIKIALPCGIFKKNDDLSSRIRFLFEISSKFRRFIFSRMRFLGEYFDIDLIWNLSGSSFKF